MKPLREHAALAIDGGGIRGVMVAQALAMVEAELGRPCADLFQLLAGTSTGSIISAGLAARIPAAEIHALYVRLGATIFRKSWRTYWPLARFKYRNEPLIAGLRAALGDRTMGEFWDQPQPLDVVITVRDLVENRTRFVKSWKPEYQAWPAWYTVLCSSTVPTFFPVVDGRYVDGGVGSYSNPCTIAAFEATQVLDWDLNQTTLISIGTGRDPAGLQPYQADRFTPLGWIRTVLDTFLTDANDQQVRIVQNLFPGLDFRRFQLDLETPIGTDDVSAIPELTRLGEKLGAMILNDGVDAEMLRAVSQPG